MPWTPLPTFEAPSSTSSPSRRAVSAESTDEIGAGVEHRLLRAAVHGDVDARQADPVDPRRRAALRPTAPSTACAGLSGEQGGEPPGPLGLGRPSARPRAACASASGRPQVAPRRIIAAGEARRRQDRERRVAERRIADLRRAGQRRIARHRRIVASRRQPRAQQGRGLAARRAASARRPRRDRRDRRPRTQHRSSGVGAGGRRPAPARLGPAPSGRRNGSRKSAGPSIIDGRILLLV